MTKKGSIPDSAIEKEQSVDSSSDKTAKQEQKGFSKGTLEVEYDGVGLATHKFKHWCFRGLLIAGTVLLTLLVGFLLWEIVYLVWKYVHYITGDIVDDNGSRKNIEELLSHIWTIVSGSSFIIVLARATMIAFGKNPKK